MMPVQFAAFPMPVQRSPLSRVRFAAEVALPEKAPVAADQLVLTREMIEPLPPQPVSIHQRENEALLQTILEEEGLPQEGHVVKLTPDQQRLLGLYFEDIPKPAEDVSVSVMRYGQRYLLLARYLFSETPLIAPFELKPREQYGREARMLIGEYRHGDMTEAERVRHAGLYTRGSRKIYSNNNPIQGTITPERLGFTIPRVLNRPPKIAFLNLKPEGGRSMIHSVGTNYIESYLQKQFGESAFEFCSLDVQLDDNATIRQKLEAFQPDIIGIATKTFSHQALEEWMRYLQPKFPDALKVMGGTMATFSFQELVEDYPQTLMIMDNGEIPMANLMQIVKGQRNEADLAHMPNMAFALDGKMALTPYQNYNMADHFRPSDTNVKEMMEKDGIIALRWSQGCWGNCTFCSLPGGWKGAAADDIISVLSDWKTRFGIKGMFFTDDEVVPKDHKAAYQRLDEFADKMIAANLDITWTVSLRADCIYWMDKPLMDKLKRSGCTSFFIGVESGSDTQLRRYGKGASGMKIDAAVNAKAMQFFKDNGIKLGVGWIPFDPAMPTLTELKENMAFLETNRLLDQNVRTDNALRLQTGATAIRKLGSYGLNLVGELQPNLLVYDATYLDPRVGAVKDHIMNWEDEMAPFMAKVHAAKFHEAVDQSKGDNPILKLGRQLQQLTVGYINALIRLFPETDEDRRIDREQQAKVQGEKSAAPAAGCDTKTPALVPLLVKGKEIETSEDGESALLRDKKFLATRRTRLLQEVTQCRPDLMAVTRQFRHQRKALMAQLTTLEASQAPPQVTDAHC